MDNQLIQIVVFITILLVNTLHTTLGQRQRSSDSILDIINTGKVQRMLAERRLNTSRDEKRFVVQNDLDENFTPEQDPPEIAIDFELHGRRHSPRGLDSLQYNDSLPPFQSGQPNSDFLADLQSFRADKLLKSSKNALIVTRKEYLKKDWCKTEPLVQRIREEGCLSRTIINRFCYGQCNSFYIPKSPKRKRKNSGPNKPRVSEEFEDEDLTEAAFRSCAFCKPKKFTWITVTLRCPSMVPQLRKKRIQRIKQCKCIAEPLQ